LLIFNGAKIIRVGHLDFFDGLSRYRNPIEEVPAQDFRDAEDDMPVGNLPEHVGTEPFHLYPLDFYCLRKMIWGSKMPF
jgi:hypothetical protein